MFSESLGESATVLPPPLSLKALGVAVPTPAIAARGGNNACDCEVMLAMAQGASAALLAEGVLGPRGVVHTILCFAGSVAGAAGRGTPLNAVHVGLPCRCRSVRSGDNAERPTAPMMSSCTRPWPQRSHGVCAESFSLPQPAPKPAMCSVNQLSPRGAALRRRKALVERKRPRYWPRFPRRLAPSLPSPQRPPR